MSAKMSNFINEEILKRKTLIVLFYDKLLSQYNLVIGSLVAIIACHSNVPKGSYKSIKTIN